MVRFLVAAALVMVPALAQAEDGQLRHMKLLHMEREKSACAASPANPVNRAATETAHEMNEALRDVSGWLSDTYRAQAGVQQGDMFLARKCYSQARLSYDLVFNLRGRGVESYQRQASERLADLRKASQ